MSAVSREAPAERVPLRPRGPVCTFQWANGGALRCASRLTADGGRPAAHGRMPSMATVLDREEYVEQAYFFRTFRERVAQNLPTQDVLATLDQEILTTTRLPMAVQFLATEIKHTGL